jgi:hypothetical protein
MALQAVSVEVDLAPAPLAPSFRPDATISELHQLPRPVVAAAARRERRKWMAIGIVVFASPFLACLGVLEVIR